MPTTIFTRQPDRENYLIESGNSLYKEQGVAGSNPVAPTI